jgi:hypothetical protein
MPGTSFSETFLLSKTWNISRGGSFLQANCVCVSYYHVANYRISCYIGTFSCIFKRSCYCINCVSYIGTIHSLKIFLAERQINFRQSGICVLDSRLYFMDVPVHSVVKQLNDQIILSVGLKQHKYNHSLFQSNFNLHLSPSGWTPNKFCPNNSLP